MPGEPVLGHPGPKSQEGDVSIVLSKIYTRAGDDGTTALGDMSRTSKTDPRLDAYSAVDEANAALGLVLALGNPGEEITTVIRWMQNDLFDVGSDLCRPIAEGEDNKSRVHDGYVKRLEEAIDQLNTDLPALRSFILPGGTPAAALLHFARTTVRSAERRTWALVEASPDNTNKATAKYLNRCADLLFVLARVANREAGDVTWTPGENQ